uniref:ATG_C domain-containing protein n=1 Tax=Meloidogyne hapla TaxID=6305 RepID=A0A1I8BTD0_MELHA
MAAPMSDWLEHMNYASQKTLDLMRLSGPVGALVAAGVSTVLSPESKEYAALKKLNEDMKRGFNKVEVRLQSIQAKVFEKIDASKYYSHVTSSIVGLESIVDLATNPIYSGHKRIKRNLIGACLSVTGPKGILAVCFSYFTK